MVLLWYKYTWDRPFDTKAFITHYACDKNSPLWMRILADEIQFFYEGLVTYPTCERLFSRMYEHVLCEGTLNYE